MDARFVHVVCKEHIPRTGKCYVKWPRRKQQLQQERWEQVCDELQLHHKQQQVEHEHAQQAPHQARHQWRYWPRQLRGAYRCVERARRAHSFTLDVVFTPHLAQVLSHFTTISMAHPLWFASPFLLLPVSSLSFPSTSSTPSCTLSSTTRSSWKACATSPTRRVRTPTTSPLPSQVMSPRSWPSASSTTHRSPSPSWSRSRTKTWMTWHSAHGNLMYWWDNCPQWNQRKNSFETNDPAYQNFPLQQCLRTNQKSFYTRTE